MTELKAFRFIALAEAVSFLSLLAATLIKYQADNAAGVEILGPVHGGLFLIYCALALIVGVTSRWSVLKIIGVLFAAVVPGGGFIVDRKVIAPQQTDLSLAK